MTAVIRMDDGDRVHISVKSTGVIIRNSRIGLLGKKIFESTSYEDAAVKASDFDRLYRRHLTPPGMNEPVLKAFTRAVLHCTTIAEVTGILNTPGDEARLEIATATG
jgi:hypothetical protein